MKIIRGTNKIKRSIKKAVVAIGIFDGVHIGHRRIIEELLLRSRRIGGKATVLTFDPHPLKVIHPKVPPPRLMSLEHRLRLIKEIGADISIVANFTEALSRYSPEDFIKRILIGRIGAKAVIVGKGFSFGRGRSGDTSYLKRICRKLRIDLAVVQPVTLKGKVVSSTRIRSLILKGKLHQAAAMLGRPVSILGTVTSGSGLAGRVLGYPTANIDPHHEALPPSGVYVVRARVGRRWHGGILNIGLRPTFTKGKVVDPRIEVHLFGFRKHIYGKELEINFKRRIRPERAFSSEKGLIKQIRKDEAKARRILVL